VTVTVKDSTAPPCARSTWARSEPAWQDFSWDGTTDTGAAAATGNYSYAVAASAAGKAVSTTAYSAQQVVGVAPQSDGSVQFLLANGSQVGFSAIAQIL